MFDRKNKKIVSIVWAVLAILVIISMILLYVPAFLAA